MSDPSDRETTTPAPGDAARHGPVSAGPTAAGIVTTLPAHMSDDSGQPFVIRRHRPADRPALEAMYADFEPKRSAQGLPPEGDAVLGRWLDRVLARGVHLVVEAEGRVQGHAMLIPMEDGGAELANFVHQSVRNRGIGTALNRVALALAHEAHFPRVWLSVEPSNRPALRSYRKAGFRRLPGSLWAPEVEMEVALPGRHGECSTSPRGTPVLSRRRSP